VYPNLGDGSLGVHVDYTTGASPYGVVVADLNGDGRLDVATANYAGSSISVLLGNGNGTLQPRTDYQVGSAPAGLIAVDLNRDGKPDLVTANYTASSATV